MCTFSSEILTAERKDVDEDFCLFKQQIFHTSLTKILNLLKPAMTTPEVAVPTPGHFEQVLVASVVQGWCAKCLIQPDGMEH
jgi:Plavaka transposase